MSESKSFAMVDKIITSAGIKHSQLQCTAKAQAATVLCAKLLAPVVLPVSFQLAKTSADVSTVVDRVVADEAFTISVLRSVALFVRAEFDGTAFDQEDVLKFYEAYKAGDAGARHAALANTVRLMNGILSEEALRCSGETAKSHLSEQDVALDGLITATVNEPAYLLLEQISSINTFLIVLAQTLIKGRAIGVDQLESREVNRIVGRENTQTYVEVLDAVLGQVVEKTIKSLIPEAEFGVITAILEREMAQIH